MRHLMNGRYRRHSKCELKIKEIRPISTEYAVCDSDRSDLGTFSSSTRAIEARVSKLAT